MKVGKILKAANDYIKDGLKDERLENIVQWVSSAPEEDRSSLLKNIHCDLESVAMNTDSKIFTTKKESASKANEVKITRLREVLSIIITAETAISEEIDPIVKTIATTIKQSLIEEMEEAPSDHLSLASRKHDESSNPDIEEASFGVHIIPHEEDEFGDDLSTKESIFPRFEEVIDGEETSLNHGGNKGSKSDENHSIKKKPIISTNNDSTTTQQRLENISRSLNKLEVDNGIYPPLKYIPYPQELTASQAHSQENNSNFTSGKLAKISFGLFILGLVLAISVPGAGIAAAICLNIGFYGITGSIGMKVSETIDGRNKSRQQHTINNSQEQLTQFLLQQNEAISQQIEKNSRQLIDMKAALEKHRETWKAKHLEHKATSSDITSKLEL